MKEDQKNLIMKFTHTKMNGDWAPQVSKEEFLRSFPDPETDKTFLPRALETAFSNKDKDEVECVLMLGYKFGFPEECVPVLCKLLMEDWHIMHEDIVQLFQFDLKDPRAVEPLYRTAFAHFPYLDYDEFSGLARKCTWALADIGTPEAKEKLQELARCENAAIAGYAQERLDHWQDELSRKGKKLSP
jgi:hypothetical protein